MKKWMRWFVALLCVSGALGVSAQDAAEKPPLSMTSGTWHIGLQGIFGQGQRRGQVFMKNLDIYPVFEDGKLVNGLATSRSYNTSIHLIESSDVVIDEGAQTIKGNMKVLLTADSWIPKDRKSVIVSVDVDGKLAKREGGGIGVSGTYTAQREDGVPIGGDETVTKGSISGSVGLTEDGWENATWSAGMTPEPRTPTEIDKDAIQLAFGVSDGKVTWGTVGIMAQAKWGTHMPIKIDVSNFGPVSSGKVKGEFLMTERHLHPAGDPSKTVKASVDAYRVQGLVGMKMTLTYEDDTEVLAAGRGSGRKGAGQNSFSQLWRYELDTRPWFVDVPGHKDVEPGEHPRLLFRKEDVPALRAKAKTPIGKAIVWRLRKLLGENGEAVTTIFNETPAHNHNKSPKDQPLGTFTSWHAAGFGFLYQLTGEQRYADMARVCVEYMLAGKMDRDNRYGWRMPGTDMRASNVLGAMGYAYDFCYDAWSDDFRRKIALEIQNYDKVCASSKDGWLKKKEQGKEVPPSPKSTNIELLVGRSKYPPGSNHYGALIGGVSVGLMAIRNDPGVDTEWVDARLAEAESNVSRLLAYGFGDGGYYSEGFPPSRLSAEGGLIQMLHALKNVMGRDYINVERPNARNLTLRWVYHLGGPGKGMFPGRGTYGGDELYQTGVRGTFSQGFGAIPEKYLGAALWSYNTFFDKFEAEGEKVFNAETKPHEAIYAFVNWPMIDPQNPAEVLPKVLVDRDHGYFVARNQWKGPNDIIVTHLIENGPKGYYAAKDGPGHGRNGRMRIWGLGKKQILDVGANRAPTFFEQASDGSFNLTAGNPVFVDMSGASGAELVIVAVDVKAKKSKKKGKKAKGKPSSLPYVDLKMDVGAEKPLTCRVFTLSSGAAPQANVKGNVISVGAQTFTYEGGNLRAAVFNPAK